MVDPIRPPLTLLLKLGSIAVHVDEMLSPLGHGYDRIALGGLLADEEVKEWIDAMSKKALLPVKRGRNR